MRISETGSRRSRLVMRLLLWADRQGGWKVFDSSCGFRQPDGSVLSPDASLLRLECWQALTEHRPGFVTVARILWWSWPAKGESSESAPPWLEGAEMLEGAPRQPWWLPGRRGRRRGQTSTDIVIAKRGEVMAQLLVRNLDLAVKEALRRRAQRHGRSMEEEVRLILRQAVEAGEEPAAPGGLGRRIASLFAAAELEQPIREWQGEEAAPAALDS